MKKGRFHKFFETYTKIWVSVLLFVALIDLQLSYVLAYMGKSQIAESLSVAVVTEIIGVVGIYMIRAFFDTANEKRQNLKEKELEVSLEHNTGYTDSVEE